MDPNHKLDFPHGFPSQPSFSPFPVDFPFDGFPQFQLDFPPAAAAEESGGAEPDQVSDPKPLECLEGALIIPPFLSKAYDLVEDPSLDPIISWGEKGKSFVVWEPAFLATIVLPRYFKHDNFSSFVRQLNSYGFRKIDPNKWEFANEFFLQGSKHLLMNIQRRKSPRPQQVANEGSGPEMETELEKLRTQKSVIMQEMAELQQQQRQAAKHLETIKQKLGDSEKRQKKMVSFLAKVVQNPEFIQSVMGMKQQRLPDSSPRTRRKIVKEKAQDQVGSSEMKSSLPLQTENVSSNELGFGHFVDLPEEFGVLDTWGLSDMQGIGISEVQNWQYDEYPFGGCGSKDF